MEVLIFKLENCSPCSQLENKMGSLNLSNLNIKQYLAPYDLPMFKKHRVSGAPSIVVLQDGIEVGRYKGADPCFDALRELISNV